MSHQHISYEEVNSIIDQKVRLELLEESAKSFGGKVDKAFDKNHVIRMKNQLVSIEEKSVMDDRLSVVQRSAILNRLRTADGAGTDENFKKLLHSYFTISGPTISSSWSRASKIESLVRFLETTARELKVEPNDLLNKITRAEGERLLTWLGI